MINPLRFVLPQRHTFLLCLIVLGLAAQIWIYDQGYNGPAIRSDGMGYYLYLPALLIDQDLSLHTLAQRYFQGPIPAWTGALQVQPGGAYLIKYPAGEAILLAPFFALASLLAWLSGAPVDGFSRPFQVCASIGGLIYGVVGVHLLWGWLRRWFTHQTTVLTLIGTLFATNLFHYLTYDALFSHVYSFFLVCAFLHILADLHTDRHIGRFIAAGALGGLIVITRPTNVLWMMVWITYGVHSAPTWQARVQFIRAHAWQHLMAAAAFMAVLAIQLSYWHHITGQWIVYAYGDERFHFAHPELVNVLFSVRKGLFFWSPVLLVSLLGIWHLKRWAPEILVPTLLMLPIGTYVIASWYCWWYGGSFGARPFVEYLPLFAACLAALIEGVRTTTRRRALAALVGLMALWNSWIMVQYWRGPIPFDGTTWATYLQAARPW